MADALTIKTTGETDATLPENQIPLTAPPSGIPAGTNQRIEMVPISALTPYKHNPRTHSRKQIRQIAKSINNPFLGSRTTLLAAERTGRRTHGIEIDPLYVDTAMRRWQKYTGKVATLAATGQSFEEVEEQRTASANAVADASAPGPRAEPA